MLFFSVLRSRKPKIYPPCSGQLYVKRMYFLRGTTGFSNPGLAASNTKGCGLASAVPKAPELFAEDDAPF